MPYAQNASDLSVTRLTDWSALGASADEWDKLAGDVPFRRWAWCDAWWRHYARPGTSPYVITVRDRNGELIGILPCYAAKSRMLGRVLRLLGSGEVCSDYLSLLAAPGREEEAAAAIGRRLAKSAAREWDVLQLDGVAQTDVAVQSIIQWSSAQGHRVHVRRRDNSWRLQLPVTWDEYLAKVSRGRRVRIRQIVKRQFETGRAVGRIAETEADFRRGWDIFCDLHQRRRQSLGERGCFASDRFAKFHAEVSRRFFDAGRLRLHWIELEGVPVAVDYAFLGNDSVYCYQSGLNPDCLDEQPGWLGWTDSIRRAIEQNFQSFDFLRGDEPYKAIWRAEPIPLMEVRIVGRHPSAVLRDRLWQAGRRAKGALGVAKRSVRQWWPGQHAQLAGRPSADSTS